MPNWAALKQKAKQKMGKAEASALPPELQDALDTLKATRAHLEPLVKLAGNYVKAIGSNQTLQSDMGDVHINFGLEQGGDLGELLAQFGEAQKSIGDMQSTFKTVAEEDLHSSLKRFEDADVKAAREVKKRQNQLQLTYDGAASKLASLNEKPAKNADKIVKAESEVEVIKAQLDEVNEELKEHLEQFEKKKTAMLYNTMANYLRAQQGFYQNVFETLQDLQPLVQQLHAKANGESGLTFDNVKAKGAATFASMKSGLSAKTAAAGAGAAALAAGGGAAVIAANTSNGGGGDAATAAPAATAATAYPAPAATAAAGAEPAAQPPALPARKSTADATAAPAAAPATGGDAGGDDKHSNVAKGLLKNKAALGAGGAAVGAAALGGVAYAKANKPTDVNDAATKASAGLNQANATAQQKSQEATQLALEKQQQGFAKATEKAQSQFGGNPVAAAAIGMMGAKAEKAAGAQTQGMQSKFTANTQGRVDKAQANVNKAQEMGNKAEEAKAKAEKAQKLASKFK